MEKQNIEIHETAFVTAYFRSLHETLSQDIYAKLWNNEATTIWATDYLNNVSSEEAKAHCLRNRYFLNTISKLVDNNTVEVLINFGAGFSMYPYLLSEQLVNIEIDKPEIVSYKKRQLQDWEEQGVLPKRKIHFLAADFSSDYITLLWSEIKAITKEKPSFILIEGVLFFLNTKEINILFRFFNKLQHPMDYIGSASFTKEIRQTLSFKRLITFLKRKMDNVNEHDYTTLEDTFYESISDYRLLEHEDYFSLSETYHNAIMSPKTAILDEHFYLLQKIDSR